MTAVDPIEFRRVMGHFATGVTIVTTRSASGQPTGLTANAVSSVSLDPPLVLACVDKATESYAAFAESKVFAVNFLRQQQETLSRRFAESGGDKFAGVGYAIGASGAPIIENALGYVDCVLRHTFDAGDHTIFVGEVVALAATDDSDPLLYFRGGYRVLGT